MIGIPYFYILQHLPTRKYYAGCKINASADSSNLMTEKGYKTTSKIVKNLIRQDGLASFSVLRIKHFQSSNQALDYETRFLVKVNAAENMMFLNRHNGGKNFVNKGGYKLKDSTKRKMSKPKSLETIQKQNEAKRNRSKDIYTKMVETRRQNHAEWHTPEMREVIRQGNIRRFSDESKRKEHSEIMKEYYQQNPISEETREKLRKCNAGENNRMFNKKHSEETREKMRLAWARRKAARNTQSFDEGDLFE